MRTNKIYVAGLLIVASLLCGNAHAATQSVNAHMTFDNVLTLSSDNDIEFGILKAGVTGGYTISTAGVVTASGNGVVVGGTAAAGTISITGSATQAISIQAGTYAANNGVTPSVATCSYNNVAIADCDVGGTGLTAPTMAGKTLKLGVTVNVDGTQAAGSTATPTFVVTVIYG